MRGEDRIAKLKNFYGARVNPVVFKDLDDAEAIVDIARQHDVVINTTLGFHPASAAAVVEGLAKRKQATGKDVFMIHTSGTSNLADRPITKEYIDSEPSREFDDAADDIYSYEKARNEKSAYGQRTTELGVVDASEEKDVKTVVIMSPTIYGMGTGYFNRRSIQIPGYVKATLLNGHGVVVGEGKGVWDNVHVEDLAELYQLVLLNILEKHGSDLQYGKKGIIFSGSDRHTWREIAEGVAEAAYNEDAIQTSEVKSMTLEEGAKVFPAPYNEASRLEASLCSNSRTKSTVARKLGWKPVRGKEAFRAGFTEEVQAAVLPKP